ncbi:hypothetical protein [Peribacillus butanolivorans]|uniref:hypothetical protein n=1 Tax=Peribacillus butanolivorans TaxID=421767 RepID=UPI00366C6319
MRRTNYWRVGRFMSAKVDLLACRSIYWRVGRFISAKDELSSQRTNLSAKKVKFHQLNQKKALAEKLFLGKHFIYSVG